MFAHGIITPLLGVMICAQWPLSVAWATGDHEAGVEAANLVI
jgi:hypothetical protein